MTRVYFHGRILPESKHLEIEEIPVVSSRDCGALLRWRCKHHPPLLRHSN
jgi:hypothetical protein